jgi:hypothetical protein
MIHLILKITIIFLFHIPAHHAPAPQFTCHVPEPLGYRVPKICRERVW